MKVPKLAPLSPQDGQPPQENGAPTTSHPLTDAPRFLEAPKPTNLRLLLELPSVSLKRPSSAEAPHAEGVLQGWWRVGSDFVRGSRATTELNRARRIRDQVDELEAEFSKMSDDQLKAQTGIFKAEIADATKSERSALAEKEAELASASDTARAKAAEAVDRARGALFRAEQKILDKIEPEAFATVREASRRATGMFHYREQVMAGALMHHGIIAEMYTGEGKTLAATLPVYLNALAGHGFHVATVNDYLARRDAEEMGQIYRWLGMSVGVLQGNLETVVLPADGPSAAAPRRAAYDADITYGTGSEFGFDYLRDNGVDDAAERVQRPLYGAILDEVDSLLIDEARIPLIMAKAGPPPDLERLDRYDQIAARIYDDVAAALDGQAAPNQLFNADDVDWEDQWIALTESGIAKVEQLTGIKGLYAPENQDELAYLQDALRAWFLMQESGQYALVDGKISTVALSGHLGPGRRFTGGLHQALEIKHGAEVQPENLTAATITMREYLALYFKRAGMTGTATSARDLFSEVYQLDVARVPTRSPLIRVDYPDKNFDTLAEKTAQFLKDVQKVHATGRPILIGAEFTFTAEWLSEELRKLGLDVQVLGAKSDAEEATIIANAGRVGAITVATTRGGRGVDIRLGGNTKLIAESLVEKEGLDPDQARAVAAQTTERERAEVLGQGGLLLMSFEHLDSWRRDDQLRGRPARQGEPGATIFYNSGEDRLFDVLRQDDEPKKKREFHFDLAKATEQTEHALARSESKVDGMLAQSLPYDSIMADLRNRFYAARRAVLESNDVREAVRTLAATAIDDAIQEALGDDRTPLDQSRATKLYRALAGALPLPEGDPPEKWTGMRVKDILPYLDRLVDRELAARDKAVGKDLARLLEKNTFLATADSIWGEFLENMLELREGIHFRAFAQKDPKQEFFREAGLLYGTLMRGIAKEATARNMVIPRLPPVVAPPAEPS